MDFLRSSDLEIRILIKIGFQDNYLNFRLNATKTRRKANKERVRARSIGSADTLKGGANQTNLPWVEDA
jgi:hypothetical protein